MIIDSYVEKEYRFELWEMQKKGVYCIFVKKNGELVPEYQMSSRVYQDGKIVMQYTESEMQSFMREKIEKICGVDAVKVYEEDFDFLVDEITEQIASGQYDLQFAA